MRSIQDGEGFLQGTSGGGAGLFVVERPEWLVERLGSDRTVVADFLEGAKEGFDVYHAGCRRQFTPVIHLLPLGEALGGVVQIDGHDLIVLQLKQIRL